MKLIRPQDHAHRMGQRQFAELFTESVDVIFAFHGLLGAIHQVLHGRPDADRFHVRGYIEEVRPRPVRHDGSEPCDSLSRCDRCITNAGRIPAGAGQLLAWCEEKLAEHTRYVVEHLEDLPEIRSWHLSTP
jgi:xylulose-5-phosphate/fructose-6-phosphate phosphoketolase